MSSTSPHRSDDPRDSFIEKLGEKNGTLAWQIWSSILNTVRDWDAYCALFVVGNERSKLFRKASSKVYAQVQKAMWSGVVLSVSRLLDAGYFNVKKGLWNVSIARLIDLVPEVARDEMEQHVKSASATGEKLVTWRTKRIAHMDQLHLDNPDLLPEIYRDDVGEAVFALRKCLKCFQVHALGWAAESPTRAFELSTDDENEFYKVLYLGITALEQREARQRELMYDNWREAAKLDEWPDWVVITPKGPIDE